MSAYASGEIITPSKREIRSPRTEGKEDVKRIGDRAVVARTLKPGEKHSRVEADWTISRFDPETGSVIVTKEESGKLISKEILREQFRATNFEQSEDMVDAINQDIRAERSKVLFGDQEVLKKREQDIDRLAGILDSFARGDMVPVREYFRGKLFNAATQFPGGEKAKSLEDVSRLVKKDQETKLTRLEETKSKVFEAEQILINLRRAQIPENDAKAKRELSLRIQDATTELALKKIEFNRANEDLQRGYPDIAKFMRFIKILDRQVKKKRKVV